MTSQANGWALYQYRLFAEQVRSLKEEVKALAQRDPAGYKSHSKTKLLASIYEVITSRVPSNPDHQDFRQGHTLGKGNSHWRRVKKGLPNRYRLFFRFTSEPPIIIYVWINDEGTLRKAGAKTDCYTVFSRMLKNGRVPHSIEELLKASESP